MSTYHQITNEMSSFSSPEIFYAFSNSQFDEGKKQIPEGEKIYKGPAGQFGTAKGFKLFTEAIAKMETRIKTECLPQEVYNYEYANHECDYTGDDEEALEIVKSYWDNADVKRKKYYN